MIEDLVNPSHKQKKNICKKCCEKKKRDWSQSEKGGIKSILDHMKKRSDKLRIKRPEFDNIDVDYDYIAKLLIDQNYKCAHTGIHMTWENNSPYKVSPDRIDNNKGYVRGNIRLTCWQANCARGRYHDEHFKTMCAHAALHNQTIYFDVNTNTLQIDPIYLNINKLENRNATNTIDLNLDHEMSE